MYNLMIAGLDDNAFIYIWLLSL